MKPAAHPGRVRLPGAEGRPSWFEVEWLDRFPARARGLLGRRGLAPGRAVALWPCGSIHTFGMRFALDIVFFDRRGVVVRAARGVRPWRWVRGGRRARGALELAAGQLAPAGPAPGDRLLWRAGDGASDLTTAGAEVTLEP